MSPYNRVEITDRDGWRKEFPLARQLVHVGSDPRNDVVLDVLRGSGVSPHHLQILAVGGRPGLRVVNLSDSDVIVDGAQQRSIVPRGALEIGDGDSLRLGEFALVFRLSATASATAGAPVGVQPAPPPAAGPAPLSAAAQYTPGPAAAPPAAAAATQPAAPVWSQVVAPLPGGSAEQRSAGIGARLSLPTTALAPDLPLDATIAVRNLGNEPGVQFRLEVLGLERDCYEIGLAPILFPGVEKAISLRIVHPQRPEPQAGRHTIQVRVSAPEAYPGEIVTVSHEIHILPYYRHKLYMTPVE